MTEKAAGSDATMPQLPQGDLGLLESETTKRLLGSGIPDLRGGAARAPPRRPAGGAARQPRRGRHHRHRGFPPVALSIRGRATVTEVDGVAPEYALAAPRYMGAEAAASYLAMIDQPGTRMARIAVRPSWVGLVDFQTRLPSTLGGIAG
jgi:hypothetical protein